MAVYVDALTDWGWKLRGHRVKSCHLFTDSLDLTELHEFAASLGMKRAWFQDFWTAPHYDLTESRRKDAVLKGAVELGRRESVMVWRERRATVRLAKALSIDGISSDNRHELKLEDGTSVGAERW